MMVIGCALLAAGVYTDGPWSWPAFVVGALLILFGDAITEATP